MVKVCEGIGLIQVSSSQLAVIKIKNNSFRLPAQPIVGWSKQTIQPARRQPAQPVGRAGHSIIQPFNKKAQQLLTIGL